MSDCGCTGAGDGKAGGILPERQAAASKLVFECQGEFARELLCCMFETGAMSDVEVVIDDSHSIRSHAEVLIRVSGYFRDLLQGNPFLDSHSTYIGLFKGHNGFDVYSGGLQLLADKYCVVEPRNAKCVPFKT